MDRSQLHASLTAAHARLAATSDHELARTGMPSALAYLSLTLLERLADCADQDEVGDLLRDLVGKEQRKVLRGVLGDPRSALATLAPATPLAEACAALVAALGDTAVDAALAAEGTAPDATVALRMTAQTITNAEQTVVYGDQHIHAAPLDETRARAEGALTDYLYAARHVCNTVQLARIDPKDGRHQTEMRLEQVYISLNTERQIAERQPTERPPAQRDERVPEVVTVLAALDQAHPARVLLLGGPGSGKSTFVNHLALCLAGACLGERVADEAARGAALLARLAPHWTHGALLPVRVVLRELAAFPPLVHAATGTLPLALLHDFLASASAPHAAALDLLREALRDGRALLLFDGLDEVEAGPLLERVTACIGAAQGVYPRSPVLVTCRVLDYEANARRHLPGFQVERLARLDDDQIDAFITAWHTEVAATGRTMLGDAAGLRQALTGRPDLRDMARQPLLLTMMTIVHAGKGTLPDARALLYSECIELLLLRWRKEPDETDLLLRLGLPEFKEPDLLKVLARLGFVAHNRSVRDPAAADRPADLSGAEVKAELDAAFTHYVADEERRAGLVVRLLNAFATRNGLLLKHSSEQGQVYTFLHRSFQEFLAGYYIGLQSDYDVLVWERAGQVGWHEALHLMVSYQALTQAPLGPMLLLIKEVLAHDNPLARTLAGELLALVGYARAAGYRTEWIGPTGKWASACATLRAVATAASAVADARLRARAGMALGQLCYRSVTALAQPGATPPATDPRLLDPATGNAPDGRYWCPVGAGTFWYGDDQKGALTQVALAYGFKIARYPVTNAEFAAFIAAGGYERQEWWTNEGWRNFQPGGNPYDDDDQEQRITLPRYWDDPDLNNPLQPVVGVSWYEAAAYSRWLTAQGHAARWLPPDDAIRLPTSLEWEHAARGSDNQCRYPWGYDAPTPEYANYTDTAIGTTSPIGCFPAGAAACGAEDLSGNVLEWLATPNEQPQQAIPEKDFTPSSYILLSGSGFWREEAQLCCGSRDRGNPFGWNYGGWSFRVIWPERASE